MTKWITGAMLVAKHDILQFQLFDLLRSGISARDPLGRPVEDMPKDDVERAVKQSLGTHLIPFSAPTPEHLREALGLAFNVEELEKAGVFPGNTTATATQPTSKDQPDEYLHETKTVFAPEGEHVRLSAPGHAPHSLEILLIRSTRLPERISWLLSRTALGLKSGCVRFEFDSPWPGNPADVFSTSGRAEGDQHRYSRGSVHPYCRHVHDADIMYIAAIDFASTAFGEDRQWRTDCIND